MPGLSNLRNLPVMSSRLCKNPEGAVFPIQVKTLEDGIDDSIHALYIDETDHGLMFA